MIKKLTQKMYEQLRDEVAVLTKTKILNSYDMVYVSKIDKSYICHASDQTILKDMIKKEFTKIQNKDNNKNHTSNIAYCAPEKKWYGWSHRAGYGYKVGDKITLTFNKKYKLPVGTILKSANDCKRASMAIADYMN